MKKVIAIFLLFQVVSNNAFGEELIKMPALFTHFYHHAYEHKDIRDFQDFLNKHYSGTNSHLKDHHEEGDCNLPFKHCGSGCTSIHSPATGFISSSLTADCMYFSIEPADFIRKDDRIESQDLCSIWQPPKIA